MGFYDDEKTAKQYIEMAKGFDGRDLVEKLKRYIPEGSSVLELGMGPGVDLMILKEYYKVTGSDSSPYFLNRFHELHPDTDLIHLNAKNININRSFDCIYSNKVLIHLSDSEIGISLEQQSAALNDGGILLHSFWRGDDAEVMEGMFFNNLTEQRLREIIQDRFQILELEIYGEMNDDDSIYVILKKGEVNSDAQTNP